MNWSESESTKDSYDKITVARTKIKRETVTPIVAVTDTKREVTATLTLALKLSVTVKLAFRVTVTLRVKETATVTETVAETVTDTVTTTKIFLLSIYCWILYQRRDGNHSECSPNFPRALIIRKTHAVTQCGKEKSTPIQPSLRLYRADEWPTSWKMSE